MKNIITFFIVTIIILAIVSIVMPTRAQFPIGTSILEPYRLTEFVIDTTEWQQVGTNGLGNTANTALSVATVYGNKLWIGTNVTNQQPVAIYTLNESDGIEAVTLTNLLGLNDTSNASITGMIEYKDRLIVAMSDTLGRGRLYATQTPDDTIFTVIDTNGQGDADNDSITAMTVFDGKLVVSYYNSQSTQGGAETYYTTDLSTFTASDTNGFVNGNSLNVGVLTFEQFNGYLWAGTHNRTGAQMYRTKDLINWNKALSDSGVTSATVTRVLSTTIDKLIQVDKHLYAVVGDSNGVRVYRTNATRDTAWTAVTFYSDSGFGESVVRNQDRVTAATVYAGKLFLGTKSANGAKIFYTDPDTNVFFPASARGFGDTTNTAIRFIIPFQGHLYTGTENSSGGELWKLTPGVYESNGYAKISGATIGGSVIENGKIKTGIIEAPTGRFRELYTDNLRADADSINAGSADIDTIKVSEVFASNSTKFAGSVTFTSVGSVATYVNGMKSTDIVIVSEEATGGALADSALRFIAYPTVDTLRIYASRPSVSTTVNWIRIYVPQ